MSHYAPLSYKTPPAPRAPAHPPMGRLRRLGLRREEEAEVYADWNAMTEAERIEAFEALSHIGDDELREQIIEGREDRELAGPAERIEVADDGVPGHGADEPLGPTQIVTAADADAAAVNPEDVPDAAVPAVLDWVGEDRARATAALVAEARRHDPPRKTLVEPLEALRG